MVSPKVSKCQRTDAAEAAIVHVNLLAIQNISPIFFHNNHPVSGITIQILQTGKKLRI